MILLAAEAEGYESNTRTDCGAEGESSARKQSRFGL